MATCTYCKREMKDLVTCTIPVYDDFPDGIPRTRIRYPDDVLSGAYAYKEALRAEDWPANCRDCGTPQGGWHHPGCCVEKCPRCKWQALSCECSEEEEL